VSIVFLSLVLGAVECLCGRREIIGLFGSSFASKYYQASLGHHLHDRRPLFSLISIRPALSLFLRAFFMSFYFSG
jgi:hypothetical protein